MQTRKPTFSILVPVYNEEQYIREALDSILAQTDPDWEALVVDDGSTDATPAILDDYARRDARFRIIHKENGGQSSAINLGVREATGEWLCWLSGDDFFHPEKLERNRRWIREYPNTEFFFSGFWLIRPDGVKIEYPLEWLSLENQTYHLLQLFRTNYVMGISICIQRTAWMESGEFDGSLRYAHDLDMWIRLMLRTRRRFLPERTCTMRYHEGQETAKFPLAPAFDASKILIRLLNEHAFRELFPNVDLSERATALDVLRRAIEYVASDRRSNLYQLGIHPLLHIRMMEWIWHTGLDPALSEELREVWMRRAAELRAIHPYSPFGLLWKATGAALTAGKSGVEFLPATPARIGAASYYFQRGSGSATAEPLRAYLEQNDGLVFSDVTPQKNTGELVLLLPAEISIDRPGEHAFAAISAACSRLTQQGFCILLIGRSKNRFGQVDGMLFLGAQSAVEEEQLIQALGPVEIFVSLRKSASFKRLKAERTTSMDLSRGTRSGEELSMELSWRIALARRSKIRMLTRGSLRDRVRGAYHILVPIGFREKVQLGAFAERSTAWIRRKARDLKSLVSR